jgi:hypothetical protein
VTSDLRTALAGAGTDLRPPPASGTHPKEVRLLARLDAAITADDRPAAWDALALLARLRHATPPR